MIDDLHKLGRIFLAGYTLTVLAALRYYDPSVTLEEMAVITSPAIGYIGLKWTGYKPSK